MSYQPLLISFDEAIELRKELGQDTLLGNALSRDIKQTDSYMAEVGIEVPGHGEGGGYEHNRHKQNYIHMDLAGRLFLITEDTKYRDYIVDMLTAYATVYPTLESNVSKDSNPPGKLFHQTLNENMWMLYASCAYSCIYHTLTDDQKRLIEDDLLKQMIEMFVVTYAHDFDIVHNHGLWAVAAVGICGYAINDQESVDKALYGLKLDKVSGGFLAQLDQLFSPDGYYMEGPYYHRFSLRPIYLFAEAIERRQPDIGIYQFNDSVIKTTSYAVFKTAFPDGSLPALNDSSKTISINDEGVIMATSVCFHRYEQTETLLGMANHQQDVWVHSSGQTLSTAVANADDIKPFNWGSLFVTDGPEGEKGGVSILRHRDAKDDDTMALIWFGQHGSDHQYHSALDHGHYDGLHLSVFNRGHEVLNDYGFGRWVNVEPKFGGRYIPENKSYCKQTVAHNTVTVDQKTQNNFDTATAESKFGQKHFFVADNPALQGMSGVISDYYDGITMQRSVILAELEEFEKPLVIDVYLIEADAEHQYDLPVHYSGQIIRTDFDYDVESKLRPLGKDNGYEHLWNVGSGKVEASALVTWLHDSSYYSLVTSAVEHSEVIFARTGANDPDFNMRSEPALIMRQSGKNHVFASVLETHGYFNESTEASLNARGEVKSVNVMGHDDIGTVIRIETIKGNDYYFAISNEEEAKHAETRTVKFDSHYYTWTGAFAQVEPTDVEPA
ncbi:heparinase II/III family protein [Shewanella sp. 1_MG-2023]|uniref:heparinase II/III domain-containing protein n=1 Tax=unclassified Shewanella TaxID=196818 RepID=UPI0026E3228B|nr:MULTISPECIES: heparinase II/III family protein [unclassified Shewanella]MDO6611178.1 heparinase II/III family protein [Shewanella sp. 7_MG-2023]MDO6770945.1 heparinase II/III family protein [Shewanella sp. 2_MG-2023]MDO6794668.1 heparinase II/III family protein [Shewanella sp. 1_MG-2023]